VHRWRAQEQAILVGGRTVLNDDPELTVRLIEGRSPLRVVLDRSAVAPADSRVFREGPATLLVTGHPRAEIGVEQVILEAEVDPIRELLTMLHRRSVRSVLVEGGARLLNAFLERGLWDEARVITGAVRLEDGTVAPRMTTPPARTALIDGDHIAFHYRTSSPPVTADPFL
jgi:diaminohydroxyphosphoribosylaminopyrimidine deaminase / 5-amino-6-(5-phosphoribosylamino)uracil reductase